MGSACSQATGQAAHLEHIGDLVVTGAGLAAIVVQGARVEKCNGTYTRVGVRHGAPVFRNQSCGGDIWICRTHANPAPCWFIVDRDKVEQVLDNDASDYYHVYSDEESKTPPTLDWEVGTGSFGAGPVPSLQFVDEGPARFVAAGAGSVDGNGTFERDGMLEGSPLYKNGRVWLYRSSANNYRWMIGDKDKILDDAGDLYATNNALEFPPGHGWEPVENGDGVLPAPTLTPLNAAGEPLTQAWVTLQPIHVAGTVVVS